MGTTEHLGQLLIEAVRGAWEAGYQPSELVRLVRHRAGADHLPVLRLAIGAELARYPADTLDPRWAGQLAALKVRRTAGPGPWWAGAGEGWTGSALVLATLLRALPPLPLLGPLPGAAPSRSPGAAAGARAVDDRILQRVRALLAKAESTPYPAEAETFTAGAQSLMSRHSIDAALLAATAPGSAPAEPVATRVTLDPPYESAKAALLSAVALANRCRTVWVTDLGSSTVVGFPTDVAAVETLYTSLLVQATSGMARAGDLDGTPRGRSRGFRGSFLLGFANRVRERLRDAAEAETRAASAGGRDLVPVLAAREEDVDRRVRELFPGASSSGRRVNVPDEKGWVWGRAAADQADVGRSGRLPGSPVTGPAATTPGARAARARS